MRKILLILLMFILFIPSFDFGQGAFFNKGVSSFSLSYSTALKKEILASNSFDLCFSASGVFDIDLGYQSFNVESMNQKSWSYGGINLEGSAFASSISYYVIRKENKLGGVCLSLGYLYNKTTETYEYQLEGTSWKRGKNTSSVFFGSTISIPIYIIHNSAALLPSFNLTYAIYSGDNLDTPGSRTVSFFLPVRIPADKFAFVIGPSFSGELDSYSSPTFGIAAGLFYNISD